ncbi:hypothetical protein [Desulfovibrio desulfuricans]|uniref:hypothetical protein n=1 Tax=Desulfovibrio desulfuricans TaxID=876 RepID=UPI00116036BF|nr:hypothetical protein [Desulfovibrio desulfuricans]
MKEDILVQPVVVFVPIVMENILTDNFFLSPHFMPPGVGGVHIDMVREIEGRLGEQVHTEYFNGAFYNSASVGNRTYSDGAFANGVAALKISRVVPVGNANKPRAWGALACCYLGQPA